MSASKLNGQNMRPAARFRQSRRGTLSASIFTLCFAAIAHAQSPHGCIDLDRSPAGAIEGLRGMFFRVDPDLLMNTRLSDDAIQNIANLSTALGARGTRLIYVPIPPKSLVQRSSLGPEAKRYGFDPRLASALYADTLSLLRRADVAAVDVVNALSSTSLDEPAFLGPDPRMSNTGLERLAEAIAAELGLETIGDSKFETRVDGELVLESTFRFQVQLACQAELPELRVERLVTETTSYKSTPEAAITVDLVGSSITNSENLNFEGFLSQSLARRVRSSVSDEDAHNAMARYLSSDEFRQSPPDYLVWAVPIWENPARFGDQLWRGLHAAAKDICSPLQVSASDGTLMLSLSDMSDLAGHTLVLESDRQPIPEAEFRFMSSEGRQISRSTAYRGKRIPASRVFMPLTGLWPEGPADVAISAGPMEIADLEVSICEG